MILEHLFLLVCFSTNCMILLFVFCFNCSWKEGQHLIKRSSLWTAAFTPENGSPQRPACTSSNRFGNAPLLVFPGCEMSVTSLTGYFTVFVYVERVVKVPHVEVRSPNLNHQFNLRVYKRSGEVWLSAFLKHLPIIFHNATFVSTYCLR